MTRLSRPIGAAAGVPFIGDSSKVGSGAAGRFAGTVVESAGW